MIRVLGSCFILLAAIALGCASPGAGGGGEDFSRSINQIKPGTPKSAVVKALGQPDKRTQGVAGAQPTGAAPPITVPAGSRYEHWLYKRGDTHYHVFLGNSIDRPGQWTVLSRSANPASADPGR